MSMIDDVNVDIINASILEAIFRPDVTELEHLIIQKWDRGDYLTPDEVLRMFNALDLRVIKIH